MISALQRRTTAARLARAALAGAAGTVVLSAFERLEWRVLARKPVYAPAAIVERLLGARGNLSPAELAAAGYVLRALYGPGLALVLLGLLRPRGTAALAEGIRVGVAIYLFELIAMPAAGATPPIRAWRKGELAALLAHTLAFGMASSIARACLTPKVRV